MAFYLAVAAMNFVDTSTLTMPVIRKTDGQHLEPYLFSRAAPFHGTAVDKLVLHCPTTESEFIAACDETKESIWLRRLYSELGGISLAMPLRCDNQGVIVLIHNPIFHQRTKPMDVCFFFVRDAHQECKINITYIDTEVQLADIFTKALPNQRFEKLRNSLNVQEFSN